LIWWLLLCNGRPLRHTDSHDGGHERGAKTSKALDKLTGQTQEYQQALGKTNAAGKADVAMSGQVATATEKLGVKKKELKEILHKLGAEFPLVAEAAKTFLNPLTAAVSIAAIYIQKLARDIKQMQESLEISEWEGYGRVIAEQKKSFEQAALGAESFKRQLKSVKDAATTASEASEKLMTIHKAMLNTRGATGRSPQGLGHRTGEGGHG
jgi:hypothetical protein